MADTRTERGLEVGAGGATLAAIAGGAALVLSILGLTTQTFPMRLLEVATVVVGGGLIIEGSALTAWFAQSRDLMDRDERASIGGSISAEMLGGVATAVLGVLALLGNDPLILVPAAAIVAGGALLVGSGAQERTRKALYTYRQRRLPEQVDVRLEGVTVSTPETRREDQLEEMSKAAVGVATAADVLVGIAAVTLGILALLEVNPMVLSLVAMMALGVAILLGGGAVGARLAQVLHRVG